MRKLLTTFCVCLLLLSCAVTAFAAESEDTSVDVKARYVESTPWSAVSPDEDGTAAVTLPDGTSLTVSGIQNVGWQLVIEPVTEKEPLDWLDSLLGGKLNDRTALHIFFLDENGTAHSTDGVTVTVQAPPAGASAYAVASDGTVTDQTGKVGAGSLTFTTNGSPFYVYGSRPHSGADTPDTPQTGDNTHLALWLTMLTVGGATLLVVIVIGAKKSRRTNRE